MRPGSLLWLGSALASLHFATAARSAEVTIELESPLAWPDTPVTLQVKITNPERGMSAPQLSPVPGLEIRGPSRPSQQSIFDGTRKSVFYAYGFQVSPTGGKTGKFTLGPATVQRQGQPALQSGTVDLLVAKRPPPGILVACEAQPATGPIGAPFKVIYTVYYSGDPAGDDGGFPSLFNRGNSLGLTGLDLPILQLSSVKLKPIRVFENEEATSVRIGNQVEIPLQRGSAEKDGFGYLTLVFGFEATPFTTGPIPVGGATVAMRLKTGGTEVRRDFFGDAVRVAKVDSFQAKCPDTAYQVRALPDEGRPAGFTGAVGRFKVSVKATPNEVDAFAPITLEVRVTGQGLLEELKPAAWSEIESLTRDFDVSTDVDSGKVDSGAKVFRQVIRPRSDKATSIPPIPFPYFDPQTMKYQVALSEAIPIKVRAVKTIGGNEAIPSPQAAPEVTPRARPSSAPAIFEKAGIGANFAEIGEARPALDPRDEVLSPPFIAVVAGPVCILAGLAVLVRVRRRDPAQKRKAKALAHAVAELAKSLDAASLAEVCEGYFRDRLGLPAGEVTPADLASALERAGAPASARIAATGILERVHAAKFGGVPGAAGALASDAAQTLQEVERCLRG